MERGPRATNLAYRLEVPKEPNAAQQELAIGKEGSYGLSIKVSSACMLTLSTVLAR